MSSQGAARAKRIAVVGAGMAGTSAARRLADAGHEVVVFEKARGPGGRMPTRRHETGAFDHGAQYFTAHSEEFRAQVEDWRARELAAVWDAEIVRLEMGRRTPEPGSTARYVGVPRMSVLARDLVDGIELRCGEHIASIEQHEHGWCLTTLAGSVSEAFEAVILATPAPQTLPLLPKQGSLASLAERVAAVEIDPCHAVLASFSAPLECGFDAAFVDGSPLAWISRNSSKPLRPETESWVLHSTPEWSRARIESDPEHVATTLFDAFAAALGHALPAPLHLASHRWRYSRTRVPLGEASFWDADLGIGVCGDWMTGARVEEAFRSGRSLARSMLETLQER